jgi:hypothetical protein
VELGFVALVVGVIIATSPVKRNCYQATLIGDFLILEKTDFFPNSNQVAGRP